MSRPLYRSLCGVWRISNLPFDEDGLLVIREDGRTIQFPTCEAKPRLNQTHRLWHSDYDGERIRFRPSPLSDGWFRRVKQTASGWDLIGDYEDGEARFPCVSADLATLPFWYEEMLEKNLTRMDELQREQELQTKAEKPTPHRS